MEEFVAMWESLAAWFTPPVLFCVANFIIATIFIASNKHHHHHLHDHEDSNSLTRTKLMNTTTESQPSQSKPVNYSSSNRLAQSIHSSSDYVSSPGLSEPVGYPVSRPALFERLKSIKFYDDYIKNACPVGSDQVSSTPGELIRAPSFLERVKSFKIASALKSEPASAQTESLNPDPSHHVIRSKSEKTPVKKLFVEMKKSHSEKRIMANKEQDVDFDFDIDQGVDAKAENFISRFKQQLKLQRLESLVRYKQHVEPVK
ncbi:hypothetical protein R6Q59_032754 [Mikania micrantha]|uniref:DUF4408 domain-containing protein n=1 Tax=Mikania micrantha TaxID=192012 RepID=A0A5N6NS66_9ASTR|nr:hypothetical protein E3N88_17360 [Mikania micrantha]